MINPWCFNSSPNMKVLKKHNEPRINKRQDPPLHLKKQRKTPWSHRSQHTCAHSLVGFMLVSLYPRSRRNSKQGCPTWCEHASPVLFKQPPVGFALKGTSGGSQRPWKQQGPSSSPMVFESFLPPEYTFAPLASTPNQGPAATAAHPQHVLRGCKPPSPRTRNQETKTAQGEEQNKEIPSHMGGGMMKSTPLAQLKRTTCCSSPSL